MSIDAAGPWRPPLGAVRRHIWSHEELVRAHEVLREHYGSASTAAMVMAYVDGRVDFITEEAHVDHVEGHDPRKLAHALKVMRSKGTDPVAFLNGQVGERWLQERLVTAMPGPPREDALRVLVLDADF